MKDEVITLDKKATARMLYHNQWCMYARKKGLRDPWANDPCKATFKTVVREFMGKEMLITEATTPEVDETTLSNWKLERDEYIRQRDEWVALKMFHRFGYETFLEDCEMTRCSEEFRKSVFPCESEAEPQCSLFCPIWKDCAIRQNGG